jgi:HAD superfamily hydrolase (TIGR01509 family)
VTPPLAVIFDFDGVIADSEILSNRALAESLCAIGLPTTVEESLRDYCGHNWLEVQRRIEARHGRRLAAGFRETHRAHSRARFEREFAAVAGVERFLDGLKAPKRAIASSSRAEYIHWALDKFGLGHHFADHVYSADGMVRGKPHPDIYLAAARGLGTAPDRCLAIEDSPVGARAAVAAGMTVVGLAAASHIVDPQAHAEQLCAAGVHHVAFSFEEIAPPLLAEAL